MTTLMSRQAIGEWSQFLRRLAQETVTHGYKVVIINALRTWQEFEEHLALRNINTFLTDVKRTSLLKRPRVLGVAFG